MARLLRQLVEASQLRAAAEPWVAGARGHRIWTPKEIAKAFQELFADKIAKTKIACAKAREEMGWPSRKDA